jgi:hypothetical protein
MKNKARPFRALVLPLACITTFSGCVVAPLGHPRYPRAVVRSTPAPAPQGVATSPLAAAPLYFYPERGQPDTVQDRDRFECYRWAVRETGTDPGMTPVRSDDFARSQAAASLPPRADGAEVVAGAATGALLGAAVSSPRHAGPNAVIGAIFGAVIGAANAEARNRAIDHAQARQAANAERAQQPLDNFRRAMTACMQGRGYRVQ